MRSTPKWKLQRREPSCGQMPAQGGRSQGVGDASHDHAQAHPQIVALPARPVRGGRRCCSPWPARRAPSPGLTRIQNPGFETGRWAPYWAGGGSFGAWADITPNNSHSGSYSAVIGYPYRASNIRTSISQYGTCQPATPYFNRLSGSGSVRSAGRRRDSFKGAVQDRFIPSFFKVVLSECTTSTASVQRRGEHQRVRRTVRRVLSSTSGSFGRGSATYVLLDDVSL